MAYPALALHKELPLRSRGLFAGVTGFRQGNSRAVKPIPLHIGTTCVITPLIKGDKERGLRFLQGEWSFAGSTVSAAPATILAMPPPSAPWAEALHTLTWLPDLQATDKELARLTARRVLSDWSKGLMARLQLKTLAKAAFNLSAAASFLSSGPEGHFGLILDQIALRLARRLRTGGRDPDVTLYASCALACLALTFRLPQSMLTAASERIEAMVDTAILPDGGPVDRKGHSLVDLALIILPLRRAWPGAPQSLRHAAERLVPMLRMLRHGDGGLASFQGTQPRREELALILASDETQAVPLNLAPYAGYARLAAAEATLIQDCGKPKQCRSSLAFEFSYGAQRLMVNCGQPLTPSAEWAEALQGTAAHNCWDSGENADGEQTAELMIPAQGLLLRSQHSISLRRIMHSHVRSLFLSGTGTDLRGDDEIRCSARLARPPKLRFHLHPNLSLSSTLHPNSITLDLPDGTHWVFSQAGGSMSIEDSLCFDGSEKPRYSRQIVISGREDQGLRVQWALRRSNIGRTPQQR